MSYGLLFLFFSYLIGFLPESLISKIEEGVYFPITILIINIFLWLFVLISLIKLFI